MDGGERREMIWSALHMFGLRSYRERNRDLLAVAVNVWEMSAQVDLTGET